MRVHRLEITAFGPFAGTEVVDFEPLNAAGVFLLTGHTGAGKTSVLDAICFALYGQVPGARDRAKAYRSHHAATGVPPRVVLEVTLQGRRFRLARQATWSRPSSRARSGFVEEKARATAQELVDGTWLARSSRADEVGHLVSRLLGLDREQFCQVVMLPQGDFQAFLRAGGRQRQHILESLFATERFQAVERWLVEHRRLQARRCRDHEEQLGRLMARLQEVCSPALSEPARSATGAADYPQLLGAVTSLVDSGQVAAAQATALAADTATCFKHAHHALDQARTLADRQSRQQAARQRMASLLATKDVVVAREESVRRARAAAALVPLVELDVEARRASAEASRRVAAARARRAAVGGVPDDRPGSVDDLEDALSRLAERSAALRALAVAEAECDRLRADLEEAEVLAEQSRGSIDGLDAEIAADPGAIAVLRGDLAALEKVAARGEDAEQRIASAETVLAAAAEVQEHDAGLERLRDARLRAREVAAEAVERWLDARERYQAGVAADLAAGLAEGTACPVCGSTSHPAPAVPGGDPVSREREAALLAAADAAREALGAVDLQVVRTERARAAALATSGGLDVAASRAAVRAARDDSGSVSKAVRDHRALSAELDRLVTAADGRRTRRERQVAELARLSERVQEGRRRLAVHQTRLVEEVGPGVRVSDALARVQAQERAGRELLAAVRTADETERTTTAARLRLDSALEASEFDAAEAVLDAAMTTPEIANAESLNRAHAVDLAAAERVLAEPALVAAAAEPPPDLAALEAEVDRAAGAASTTAAAATDVHRRQDRLEELALELGSAVAALEPLRAAKDLADDVAGMCCGTSADNHTRTALSHYVLAARLAQVVSAANLRLGSICSGRYQLEHTMTREAGDSGGGLGLVVTDTHTDCRRDPATLSGGETFYVSLSLALGLADVVTNEAGGAELSTLFVDEGFGGLDDATRDEVLDALDALRSGGRTIGLVSHLDDLRARFPVQLRVLASRSGSRCLATSSEAQ